MKTVTDTASFIGVTYRQLNHWITKGYIVEATGQTGTGNQQWLNWPQIRKASLMAELVAMGMTLSSADKFASGNLTWIGEMEKVLEKCRGEAKAGSTIFP